ncbi:MAG TPA: TlpA family protein disulfide reductase [Verrucomicrobiae bacterium]|jgi:Thiol-disulfide isomerase and thioredoxins
MSSLQHARVALKLFLGLLPVVVALIASGAESNSNTRIETTLSTRAAQNEGITQADDPALTRLGEAVIRFVRSRDVRVFKSEVLPDTNTMWEIARQSSGAAQPSRDEFEKSWAEIAGRVSESARKSTEWMTSAGIDFQNADIRLEKVSIKELLPRTGATNLDGLTGVDLKIILSVKSDAKSNTGKSLSGKYVFSAYRAIRSGGRWFIHRNVYWAQIPDGVADPKALAELELENYVAENRALPPGTVAPDAIVIRVSDQRDFKLSDLRGKVVVLDFWATWCPPCQEPMAKLQQLRAQHPDWKDRVELVPISIDATFKVVPRHLQQRGWTNTLNTWAGAGTFSAEAPKAYRVSSIPTTYIIDSQGKIAASGLPENLNISRRVDELLKTTAASKTP